MPFPRITFGIIVLNGEPFTRYTIQQIYEHAHEIIVAEGACFAAAEIADARGHSRDGTLEVLADIQRNHDPDNKITVITAEDEGHPDGFWPGEKEEQCRAWSRRATGDYIWQVDIDEFYRQKDIARLGRMLQEDPELACIEFAQVAFWGNFDYQMDGWYFQVGTRTISKPQKEVYRISRWGEGYEYTGHRPLTVRRPDGTLTRDSKTMTAADTEKMGLYMYHYAAVFRHQVEDKLKYYAQATWKRSASMGSDEYLEKVYSHLEKRPFRVHFVQDYPSWLVPFTADHPESIQRLKKDVAAGAFPGCVTLKSADIDRIIKSPAYRRKRWLLQSYTRLYPSLQPWVWRYNHYLGDGLGTGIRRLRDKVKR